jgi:hypothetical protein
VRQKERRSMEERLRDQEGDIRRRMEEIRSGLLSIIKGTLMRSKRLTNRIYAQKIIELFAAFI